MAVATLRSDINVDVAQAQLELSEINSLIDTITKDATGKMRAAYRNSHDAEKRGKVRSLVFESGKDQSLLDELRRQRNAIEARTSAKMSLISEPRVYDREAGNSWYRDSAILACGEMTPGFDAAEKRMTRYASELAVEARNLSPEGMRAIRLVDEQTRGTSAGDEVMHRRLSGEGFEELRAGTSTSIAGFTSPYWTVPPFALYRDPHRTLADHCMNLPLPPYGLEVHIPSFTSDTNVGIQAAENFGNCEADPAGADLGASSSLPLKTLEGQVIMSLPLFQRGGDPTIGMDQIIGQALQQKYDSALDLYVINAALVNATAVSDATAPAQSTFIPGLLADLAKAREGMTDTAGVRLRATHIFSTSDLWCYVSRQCDNVWNGSALVANRPVCVPQFKPGVPFFDDGDRSKYARFTGYVTNGMMWFEDDNIPASGSNTQIIVSRPDTVLLYEGTPLVQCYPEPYAASLSVIVRMYTYAVAVPRFALAHSKISGNAYPTSLV